ncbi:MAG TPA: SMP-30/gluconolactonase/LRE family protein [Gemmataceae bacterium]|nr:SMP-30/gluconolactonase/LRE family protein [Gemmataceae bacterium]
MKRFILLSAFVVVSLAAALTTATRGDDDKKTAKTLGKIERIDPEFDDLIGPDAKLEVLATGHDWTEGPVWAPLDGGFLLFSDIPRNRVYKWQEGKGESVFLEPSGGTGQNASLLREPGSNGLLLDPDGRLVLMEHGDRRVALLDSWGGKQKTTLAHRYMGKRLNSPNDGAFKSNGDLYFTDPPYGRSLKKPKPSDKEFPDRDLDFCGVYRLSKDGQLTLLTKEMSRPNGIAFSPDETTLYVANSDPAKAIWMAFPVKADGTLGEGRVFFDATRMGRKGRPGLPDGMKVDVKGNVFATGPGGVLVFSPDGKHLGTIITGVNTANCAWGDDGSMLYVCADKALTRIKTKTKGKVFAKK